MWVQNHLENLRQAAKWCRNVCTFHGVSRAVDNYLCLVMDRCYGSLQSAMQRNEGRLTLEQILRFVIFFSLEICDCKMNLKLFGLDSGFIELSCCLNTRIFLFIAIWGFAQQHFKGLPFRWSLPLILITNKNYFRLTLGNKPATLHK